MISAHMPVENHGWTLAFDELAVVSAWQVLRARLMVAPRPGRGREGCRGAG